VVLAQKKRTLQKTQLLNFPNNYCALSAHKLLSVFYSDEDKKSPLDPTVSYYAHRGVVAPTDGVLFVDNQINHCTDVSNSEGISSVGSSSV